MRAIIIRFEGSHAICMRQDLSIIDLERITIPMAAEEGDALNIEESSITIEKQMANVIIDLW